MNKLSHKISIGVVLIGVMILSSCGGDENSPGLEYMPDMYRSPAIEAYVDYGQDPFYIEDSIVMRQRTSMSARLPVEGTIPFSMDSSKAHFNYPYAYENTNAGYDSAGTFLKSPFPSSEATVEQGKVIYEKFCIHCHGKTGKGDGSVVAVGGHPPPGAYDDKLKDLTEGHIFHSITYGKGVMGSHASQLNKEERWKVVHYVQTLQKPDTEEDAAESADSTAVMPADTMAQGN